MICPPCARQAHRDCLGCPCQHKPKGTGLTAAVDPEEITSLVTCQMGASRETKMLFAPRRAVYDVHLVRSKRSGGTPGPTLCDIARFGHDAPGWDLMGGTSGPDVIQLRCGECTEVAHNDYPGLPIAGMWDAAELFREALRAYANNEE